MADDPADLRRELRSLGPGPFVQADLFDLPCRAGCFETVACHGLLHLFDDPARVPGVLRSQMAPRGSLYVSSPVAGTTIGTRALRLLHRAGEAAAPRRETNLAAIACAELGDGVEVRRDGAMALLRSR